MAKLDLEIQPGFERQTDGGERRLAIDADAALPIACERAAD